MDYLLFLQGLRESAGDLLNTFLYAISELMGGAIGMAIPAVIYWCIDKRAGSFMLMGFSGSFLLNQTLKNIFCVYRPWILDSRITPMEKAFGSATGYSFPSGHATMATASYGGVAIWQRRKKPIVCGCVFLTLLTGFSRNWLGVHTLWDVLAALVLSASVLIGCAALMRYIDKHPKKDLAVLIAGACIAIASLIFIQFKSYPNELAADGTALVSVWDMQTDCFRSCGIVLGYLLGWFLERRFVKFEIKGGALRRIVLFLIGLAAALLLYAVLLPLAFRMLNEHLGKLLKYFFSFLFIAAGYPAVMKAINKRLDSKSEKDAVGI